MIFLYLTLISLSSRIAAAMPARWILKLENWAMWLCVSAVTGAVLVCYVKASAVNGWRRLVKCLRFDI